MKKIIATSIILILLTINIAADDTQSSSLKRFAIFAGSNDGGIERTTLEYAETDAMSMYEVLAEIGGLSSSDSIILADPQPQDIEKAFEIMKSKIKKERQFSRRTEFFFYYSGHSDESGILPGGDLIDYAELRKDIDSMGTDVKIAILDSCSSGSFTRLKGGVKRAPFMIDESVDTTGHAFLTSSSENEAAQESDAIEGSFFTHYLISALRGAADSTQDGTVTLNEAYSFAADETLARTTSSIAGAQHPSYSINLTGSGDLVLTDLREVASSISIAKEIDGRIFFRDSSDRLVLEFRKRTGIPVSLSLPTGVYNVELESEEGLASAIITVSGDVVHLSNSHFNSTERTFARTRGDDEPETTLEVAEEAPEVENVNVNVEVNVDTPDKFEEAEESLERKMEEIRSIINDKFGSLPILSDANIVKKEIPEVQAPEEEERTDLDYRLIGFYPTPSRSSSNDVTNLSLHFIGKPYSVYGIAVGFMNFTHHDVYGVQIGAISSQSGRDQYGAQISGIYNIVSRDLWGTAISGIFNINQGRTNGLQTAGIFNISSQELNGIQVGGIFNIANNYSNGAQIGGIFNITGGKMNGLQTGGIFNVASGQMSGLQISGIINVADNLNGGQISLINVGGVINGMQIGLININEDINGLPIGLITISKNGIMDFGGWYESSGFFYTGIQTGSKNFYNFGYVGFPAEDQGPVLVAGLGIGARINLGSLYVDLDTSVKSVTDGADYTEIVRNTFSIGQVRSLYPNLRISGGLKMFHVMSLYGGMSLDVHLPGITERSEYFHNYENPWELNDPQNGSTVAEFHPKWYGGLKINL